MANLATPPKADRAFVLAVSTALRRIGPPQANMDLLALETARRLVRQLEGMGWEGRYIGETAGQTVEEVAE